jgi:hypothetical protein
MAEGLLDRLLNSAYMITMLGRSYRPQQRPGTSTSTASTKDGDLQLANYREQSAVNIDTRPVWQRQSLIVLTPTPPAGS